MARTQEQIDQFFENFANEDGSVDEETMSRFLDGEDMGKEDIADKPAAEEPAASEEETDEEDKKISDQKVNEDDEEGKAQAPEKDPMVLAKDGEHTIPFSVVEELRQNLQSTRQEKEELKQALTALQQAQDQNKESGTDEATSELLEELEADYPGITEHLKKTALADIQPTLDSMKAVVEELKSSHDQQVLITEQQEAQTNFDKAVTDIDADYPAIINDDHFWEWFEKQPGFVQAVRTSGDPQQVADVLQLYKDAVGGDTAKKEEQVQSKEDKKEDLNKKAKELVEKIDNKATIQTLSDIPGSGNPAHDELAALENLDGAELLAKMEGWDAQRIENYLNKVL